MHATVLPLCGDGVYTKTSTRSPRRVRRSSLGLSIAWSFCCSLCRQRTTPMSVRFLGGRVYVLLAVVLLPQRRSTLSAAVI
ncbi:MAG: hypothetical protein IPH54_11480 [Rhodoferax sp.]|nr:hypothetical protein [Rhodoferax sp.]